MVGGGPSPKRRRTDNGHVSAEEIAQANSTVQFFTGQRQNRWMQGYIATDNGCVHSSPRQTPAGATSTVRGSQARPVQPPSDAEGTNGISSESNGAAATVNIVEYEFPTKANAPKANSATTSVNETSRNSTDRMARTGALPSPVSSDGHINSPAAPQYEPAPKRKPSQHRNSSATTPRNGPTGTGNGSTPVSMHQRVPSQPQARQYTAQGGQSPRQHGAYHAMYGPASAQQASSPTGHSHPFLYQPPHLSEGQKNAFDQGSMLHRLDAFQRNEGQLPRLPFTNVDHGRLTLLRDAIEKGDMFYITLSQIHSLTSLPKLLPQRATTLDVRSFSYLDILLCPNKAVNQTLLTWLTEFPAPIMSIYSSHPVANFYDGYVQEVVNFLDSLPGRWNAVVSECKKRQAPPLMEDLTDGLGMLSPVLQTTAFRAIARMVVDVGAEALEVLHRKDQEAFMRGRRRNPYEKGLAYYAFGATMQAWKQYEQRLNEHRLQQQRVGHRLPSPNFVIPNEAMAAFGSNAPAPSSHQMLQSNSHLTSAQQQLAVVNAQALMRGQRTLFGGSGSPTLAAPAQQPLQSPTSVVVLMPAQQRPPGPHLMFPHELDQPRAQPTEPDANKSALHQAHLRSPRLGSNQPAPNERLYRYVSNWAMLPRKINKDEPVEKIRFSVAQETVARFPAGVAPQRAGELPTRIVDRNSQTIRLRCSARPPKGFTKEHAWVEADNVWPDNLYLQCNGHILEPRRKLHHGRYLPIDLTSYVALGENELTVIVNRMSTDDRPFEYALAVEIVGIMTHESVQKGLHCIDAAESLAAIKKSLSGGDDDDDVAITSSNVTINLFDPYSHAKMFDIPVRGAACLHKDCFDLETFLQMRKREKPGWPTVVDCWRCPICRGDVRPHNLVLDGFLVEVRKELEKKKLLDTRAILVEPDGRWKPKEEERTGVRSPSLEREERIAAAKKATPSASATATPPVKKVLEIIEID